jgi:hypothetical protein
MKDKILSVIATIKTLEYALHTNTFKEVTTRLNSVESQYSKLMELNKEYLAIDPMKTEVDFDEQTGVMTFIQQGKAISSIKLNRANPNVPVKLMSKSDVSSFIPDDDQKETSAEMTILKKEIARELENFYFNASKLWDLIEQTICKKPKSDFIAVKMVRNKLIEHTEEGDIYSFGASEEWGPSVKPSQLTSRKEKWHDKGLRVNTEELIDKIEARLNSLN